MLLKGAEAALVVLPDVVAVVRWLIETPSVSGIFNVGTGEARSFRALMEAIYTALGTAPNLDYVDMPAAIRDSYGPNEARLAAIKAAYDPENVFRGTQNIKPAR